VTSISTLESIPLPPDTAAGCRAGVVDLIRGLPAADTSAQSPRYQAAYARARANALRPEARAFTEWLISLAAVQAR
jgi:hypothetical protein